MQERPHDQGQPDQQPEQPESWPYEPDTALETTGATPTAPAPWWRQPGPAILAGAVIIAAGVGIGIALTGGSGSTPAAAASTTGPPSINMHGSLTIPFITTDLFNPNAHDTTVSATEAPRIGDPCEALGGYSDISTGVAVTIGGSSGQTLAVGALGAGSVAGQPGQSASCEFTFNVDVPGGQSLYTVTISHRGTQTFTPDQVAAGISLTLGS
jgi:hypothetical protein